MKSSLLILSALVAGTALGAPDYAAREVLVKFKPNATYAKAMALNLIDGQVVKEFPFIGWTLVRYQSGYTVPGAVAYFKGFADVQKAEPNYLRKPLFTPNDPRWNQQYGPKKIKADLAWNIGQGSSSVVIAVLDTGIDLNHQDFAGKLVPGFDYSDNDSDPSDAGSHGTHCAGIAAAATNNGMGVAGTGFNCKIMPLKIFPNAFASVVIASVKHAADNGAKVISMSFGGAPPSQAEQDAMNYAMNKNVICIAGAGNNGNEVKFYPAAYPGVVSVAATDQNDNMAGFSTHGDWVRVAAPGVDIMSTLPGNNYGGSSGTSMSCPMVAGVAGLLYARGGATVTMAAVRDAIYNNCDPVGNWVHFGRVNAFRAIQAVAPPISSTFVPNSVSMHTGASSSGTVANIVASENLTFNVNSTSSSLGQVAAAAVDVPITGNMANVISLKLHVEARGAVGGTVFFYLKNWNTGQWDNYKAMPSETVDKLGAFDIAPISKYVSSGGVVSVLIRNTRSPRVSPLVPFVLGIDQVKVTGVFSS